MPKILVTGGTGGLGRELVPRLIRAGYPVCVMSRRERRPGEFPEAEWAQADLETGQGLAEAVAQAHIVVHAGSNAAHHTRETDVEGTRRLTETAKAAGVSHFLYVSIVGIERVLHPYYQHKVAAEEIVSNAGVPWSILRATQFHSLIDSLLQSTVRWPLPLALVPADLQFQPVDTGEVAHKLIEHLAGGPAGRLPDLGGPEVLTLGAMARVWLQARRMRRLIVPLPLPTAWAEGYRRGYNTCPDHKVGQMTWAEWVQRKYK